jgi:hypothetical protein
MVFDFIKWFRSCSTNFVSANSWTRGHRPLTQINVTQVRATDVTQVTASYCGSVHSSGHINVSGGHVERACQRESP